MRPLSWGVPAFFIVIGAVSLEPIISRALPQWLLSLGDASYSIYLSHGFVLPALVYLAGRSLSPGLGTELTAVILCVVVSAIVGWLLFVAIENPMIRAFRSRPVKAVAVASGHYVI
jgi:exopolysaccharide production protein ExoZ